LSIGACRNHAVVYVCDGNNSPVAITAGLGECPRAGD